MRDSNLTRSHMKNTLGIWENPQKIKISDECVKWSVFPWIFKSR